MAEKWNVMHYLLAGHALRELISKLVLIKSAEADPQWGHFYFVINWLSEERNGGMHAIYACVGEKSQVIFFSSEAIVHLQVSLLSENIICENFSLGSNLFETTKSIFCGKFRSLLETCVSWMNWCGFHSTLFKNQFAVSHNATSSSVVAYIYQYTKCKNYFFKFCFRILLMNIFILL